MGVLILSALCIALLLALTFMILKVRPLYRDLERYRNALREFDENTFIAEAPLEMNLGHNLKTLTEKSGQFKNDPLVNELAENLSSRAKFLSWVFVRILESSQIILGISAGLFGMSVVAVVFHLMTHVGNHATSKLLESVSYSIFFLFVTIGIFSNRYFQRKIIRAEDKLLKAEISFQEKLLGLKSYYEEMLDKVQSEQDTAITAKAKIVHELSQLAEEQKKVIAELEDYSKKERSFFKIGRWMRHGSKSSPEPKK